MKRIKDFFESVIALLLLPYWCAVFAYLAQYQDDAELECLN